LQHAQHGESSRPAGADDAADIALAQLLAWQRAYDGILPADLGSALFRESEAALAGVGYQHAYLWVAAGKDRAARFLRSARLDGGQRSKNDRRFTPALLEHRFSTVLP
jgi:hypothetical protein